MVSETVVLLIEFSAHAVLLTVMLWIMIKLQKLDYNFPGLIGSAVLGGGLDMIPYFGHALAVPVLYFCIWKMTRASLFPDAAFTVVVAYALMFAFNMLVLTGLMGDLRPDLHVDKPDGSSAALAEPASTSTNSSTSAAAAPAPSKAATAIAKSFVIKGFSRNGDKSSVTIQCGEKDYFVFLNQVALITTDDDGIADVRLTALGEKSLTLEIRGEPVSLSLP
jgi:hypothetical protein